jgi:hypothetical protein
MPKTFKSSPATGSGTPKSLFERDFFDMTEEANLPVLPLAPPAVPPVGSPAEGADIPDIANQQTSISSNPKAREEATPAVVQRKPSKQSKVGTPGNTPQSGIPLLPASTTPADKSANSRNVRQTFVLDGDYLERIRDYVHARRSLGDYRYSQKQMLEEALDLLLASQNPVPPRPTELREQEQLLRVRIQQGRQANTAPKPSAKPGTTAPQSDDAN